MVVIDIIKLAFEHGPPDPHQPRRMSKSRKGLRSLQARYKVLARVLQQLPRAAGSGGPSRSVPVDQLTSDMFELRGVPDKKGNPGPLLVQSSGTPDPAPKNQPRSRTWQSNPHLGPQDPQLIKRATAPAVMGSTNMQSCWYLKGPLIRGSGSSGAPVQLKPGKRKPILLQRQFQGNTGTHLFMQRNENAFMAALNKAGDVLYLDTGIVARLAPR